MPLSEYLDILSKEGRPLDEIGVNEIALPRDAALKAIEALKNTALAILGGDVYKLVSGKPDLSYDNWYCNREASESASDYAHRSWTLAEKYIRDYKETGKQPVLYSLIVSGTEKT